MIIILRLVFHMRIYIIQTVCVYLCAPMSSIFIIFYLLICKFSLKFIANVYVSRLKKMFFFLQIFLYEYNANFTYIPMLFLAADCG